MFDHLGVQKQVEYRPLRNVSYAARNHCSAEASSTAEMVDDGPLGYVLTERTAELATGNAPLQRFACRTSARHSSSKRPH